MNCQVKSEMAANDQHQKDQKESREPAHHARRPMNAFLIFCKRHRGSVRLHFPHLENRAVTRVLGEWWATLHQDQKKSYINLAQEYKDAFLNANPDFKWYKLPAPPLRTLSTRPTNKKAEVGSNYNHNTDSINTNYESSNCTDIKNDEGIQPGKLADESQIGGLSSLFTPHKVTQSSQNDDKNNDIINNRTTDGIPIPKPPKKRYTELPVNLEQKNECKVDLFGHGKLIKMSESNNNNSNNNNNQQQQENLLNDEEQKINNTSTTAATTNTNTNNIYLEENNLSLDDNNFRGERSCKGLRYQTFLAEQIRNVGLTNQQVKRKRTSGHQMAPGLEKKERRNSVSSNVSEKTDSLSSEGGNSSRSDLEHLVDSAEGKVEASKPEDTETEEAESHQEFCQWTSRKRFKAEDFNLEKKIEALPSLSLEEFQEKKKQQRTKKKKVTQKLSKNSSVKNNDDDINTSDNTKKDTSDVNEESEKTLVGSQKRKARKESITRNTSAVATKSNLVDNEQEKNQPWCASPDLEALACLAEIAANQTKLTK